MGPGQCVGVGGGWGGGEKLSSRNRTSTAYLDLELTLFRKDGLNLRGGGLDVDNDTNDLEGDKKTKKSLEGTGGG